MMIVNGGPSELFARLNALTGDDGTYSLTLSPGHPLGTALAVHGALPPECTDITFRFPPDGLTSITYTTFATKYQAALIIAAMDSVEQ